MTSFPDIFTQIRSFWQEASTTTRAAIAGGAVFLLALVIGVLSFASAPDFVAIHSGTPTEAQSLAKELDRAGIPYQISEDGGTLSVRRTDSGRARQTAGTVESAATGTTGLRGIESMGPFTTYEQQRVRIERAQEEAIEQQLAQYAGIQKVSVNLALAQDDSRVGEVLPPKAAVTLTPSVGTRFTEAQVAAMASVVANSIPNLTPENVTIASAAGETLWAGAESIANNEGNNLLKLRTQAEKEFVRTRQAELQANLDRVFGPGKAVVYVDATLDMDKQETEADRIVPVGEEGKGLPVSEATTTEQYTGSGAPGAAAVGGAAGTDANRPDIPTYGAAAGGSNGSGNYKNTTSTINYENSTEKVRTTKAAGEPKRMNVSLMVDDKLPVNVQNAIRTWAQGSVINPTNAATTAVTVVPAPFDRTVEMATRTARDMADRQEMLTTYAPYIVLPLCLAIMLLVAWLLTRPKKSVAIATADSALALAGAGAGIGAITAPAMTPLPGTRVEDMLAPTEMTENVDLETMLGDGEPEAPGTRSIGDRDEPELVAILDFINKRPETAALLLRSWTVDEPRARG